MHQKSDIPLKQEFRNNKIFRPEPLRSQRDQEIIDRNAAQLIADGRAFFNPSSKHNICQVIVPRLDKNRLPVPGRERVCLDLKPVNKCLEHYDHPIPNGYDSSRTNELQIFLGRRLRLWLPSIPSLEATSRHFHFQLFERKSFHGCITFWCLLGRSDFSTLNN